MNVQIAVGRRKYFQCPYKCSATFLSLVDLTCQSSHKAGASCILLIIHRAIFVIICDLFFVKRNNQHPSHRPAYNLSASR